MSCSAAYSGNVSSASALRGSLYVVVIIDGAFDSIGFHSHYGASTALFLDVSYRVSPVLPHILTGRELGQLIDILEGEVRQNSLADVGRIIVRPHVCHSVMPDHDVTRLAVSLERRRFPTVVVFFTLSLIHI